MPSVRPNPIRMDPVKTLNHSKSKKDNKKSHKKDSQIGSSHQNNKDHKEDQESHVNQDRLFKSRFSPYFKKNPVGVYRPEAVQELQSMKQQMKNDKTLINQHILVRT